MYDMSHHFTQQANKRGDQMNQRKEKQTSLVHDYHAVVYEELKDLAMQALMLLESLIGGSLGR